VKYRNVGVPVQNADPGVIVVRRDSERIIGEDLCLRDGVTCHEVDGSKEPAGCLLGVSVDISLCV